MMLNGQERRVSARALDLMRFLLSGKSEERTQKQGTYKKGQYFAAIRLYQWCVFGEKVLWWNVSHTRSYHFSPISSKVYVRDPIQTLP